MNFFKLIISGLLLLTVFSCNKNEVSGEWLIPREEVFDGGPGKDGIPSIDNPELISSSEASYLDDHDVVVGFRSGNDIRAYPHPILDWHEIINDELAGVDVAIIYCPLTGTATAWDRNIDGKKTTFGVSGLLYNTNIIPYDRKTDSNWSQMQLECVNGKLAGEKPKIYHSFETSWGTWRAMYPNSTVVSSNTGFSRNYNRYPYGDYRSNNNSLLFPVDNLDNRVPAKERVHGVIIRDKVKAYRFKDFAAGLTVIRDQVNGEPVIVAGDSVRNFIVSFHRILPDNNILAFEAVQDQLPVIMKDDEGNLWDIFGFATEGPRKGQQLISTLGFMGYWFAWGAFYENIEL